mgnify:CR=1 FL=1|jgi:hypothetical protein
MRFAGALYTLTFVALVKAAYGFSSVPEKDVVGKEEHFRLLSLFSKNKYGYNTRFMSEFELFLEAVLNEKFIDDSTSYYQNELTNTEVEDMEGGLVGEFSQQDMANLLHDVSSADHENFKALRYPDRVGTNYPKGDALSCYKILPKKQ